MILRQRSTMKQETREIWSGTGPEDMRIHFPLMTNSSLSPQCFRSSSDHETCCIRRTSDRHEATMSFIDSEDDEDHECNNEATKCDRGCCCCFGIRCSLYEKVSVNGFAGDPIADSFLIFRCPSFCMTCVADGVNWGEGAATAAKEATSASMNHLKHSLSLICSCDKASTRDVFVALLRSFVSAHEAILSSSSSSTTRLTTLTIAVSVQSASGQALVCTCNVGDSLAFVYEAGGRVREITVASHDVFSVRDMRDALGALGTRSSGEDKCLKEQLANLTIAMTRVVAGDIVFVTSDGVSDNFDPLIISKSVSRRLTPVQRYRSSLHRMSSVIGEYHSNKHKCDSCTNNDHVIGPEDVCHALMSHVQQVTQDKRSILESDSAAAADDEDEDGYRSQREKRKRLSHLLSRASGKLDHATVAAFRITTHCTSSSGDDEGAKTPALVSLQDM